MYDILIKNGTVIDGSGAEGFVADVAVQDGKIVAVGQVSGEAVRVIDAKGLVVTPGFIDSHAHSDRNLLTYPEQIEKVEQGITTAVGGQCGSTAYPAVIDGKLIKMSQHLQQAYATPQGSNQLLFVGHRALRQSVMGVENRPATEEEIRKMEELLRDAMDAGAMGVSFGLIYTPSCFANTDELIALAKVAKEKGGMISAHLRNEADRVEEAVEEFISIVKAANIRGVISHHKSTGTPNHGKVKNTLAMMEKAIAEGCDLYCDVYPYIASRTSLSATFIPKDYIANLSQNLKDPALRQSIRETAIARWGTDLSWVLLNDCTAYPAYSGLRISEAAKLHGKDDWDTLLDILETQPGCCACYFTMREEDVHTVMSWPRAMICTDSGVAGNSTFYHPRLRGSFPRVLGRYVREAKVVPLPEMIRKITSLPAMVYGLRNKGYLREGYDADICIFDPETILDNATYLEPFHRADGLNWVIVGGVVAAENAVFNGAKNGRVLPRQL